MMMKIFILKYYMIRIKKHRLNLILTLFIIASPNIIFGQVPSPLSGKNTFNSSGKADWLNDYKKSIDLSENKVTDTLSSVKTFSFNSGTGLVETWGRGSELPGVYFNEKLPLLFIRQLNFSSFSPNNGVFEWIFTGELGGVTVAASADSIWLIQRFYGAYGYNLKCDKIEIQRHPEKIWSVSRTYYSGKIESIALISNHKTELQLFVNGQKIATQCCLQDFSHHQLRFVGNQAEIAGLMMKPKLKKVEINVDENSKHQKMLGWGGIAIPTAYNMLSEKGKEKYWQFISEYNLLVHREYPIGLELNENMDNWDNLDDARVHYYGDNFPNSEISDFNYIRRIQELGGINIFEFWKFPPWIQENIPAGPGILIPPVNIEKYCKAMVNYCWTAKSKTGQAPAILGIQNEKNQPAETWYKLTLALRSALDENGFSDVKIHMHNAANLKRGIEAANAFAANKQVWESIDFAATNVYDYQEYFANPDGFDEILQQFKNIVGDKPFISTEVCVNFPFYQIPSYRLAFTMAQLYHKNLVITNATSIMYCWILLNNVQSSYDATRSLFGVDEVHGNVPKPSSFQARAFGAFSRRIKKDMQRVESSADMKDLLVSFYTGNQGKTAVVLNRSISPVEIDISKIGFIPAWIEKSSYFLENEIFEWEGNNRLIIEPGEIITLTNVLLNKLK